MLSPSHQSKATSTPSLFKTTSETYHFKATSTPHLIETIITPYHFKATSTPHPVKATKDTCWKCCSWSRAPWSPPLSHTLLIVRASTQAEPITSILQAHLLQVLQLLGFRLRDAIFFLFVFEVVHPLIIGGLLVRAQIGHERVLRQEKMKNQIIFKSVFA